MTHLSGLPLPRLLEELARLPARTIVIYLTIFEDGSGELFIPRDLAATISAAASAPVYGVYEPYVGRGIVGGYVESFEAIGRETARIALRVLAGASPESLPPQTGVDPGVHGRLAAAAPLGARRSAAAPRHHRALRAALLMAAVPPRDPRRRSRSSSCSRR